MSHYFTNDEVKSEEKKITVKIENTKIDLYVDNGVFSKKGLDYGTRSMLEALDINEIDGDILDLGCGYGPIGIFLALNTNSIIDMVDINTRAINLAKKNAELNKVKVNIYESDAYKNVTKKYDYIITNPPIRVGKEKLYEMLYESLNHLKENGKLIFVINKDQGAKSTLKNLNEKYETKVIKKNKGFYVIEAKNRWH